MSGWLFFQHVVGYYLRKQSKMLFLAGMNIGGYGVHNNLKSTKLII